MDERKDFFSADWLPNVCLSELYLATVLIDILKVKSENWQYQRERHLTVKILGKGDFIMGCNCSNVSQS